MLATSDPESAEAGVARGRALLEEGDGGAEPTDEPGQEVARGGGAAAVDVAGGADSDPEEVGWEEVVAGLPGVGPCGDQLRLRPEDRVLVDRRLTGGGGPVRVDVTVAVGVEGAAVEALCRNRRQQAAVGGVFEEPSPAAVEGSGDQDVAHRVRGQPPGGEAVDQLPLTGNRSSVRAVVEHPERSGVSVLERVDVAAAADADAGQVEVRVARPGAPLADRRRRHESPMRRGGEGQQGAGGQGCDERSGCRHLAQCGYVANAAPGSLTTSPAKVTA